MDGFFKLWVWRIALRDSRRGLRPLLLSMSSVILAVAAVVAAFSFRDNLQSNIQTQSKSLLGADLALDSREPFSPDDEALFRSLGGEQSRQVGFSSMALFPRSGDSRLVQVRALSGAFPYYGVIESEPTISRAEFQGAASALVDESMMLQFNAQVGDRIKIGEYEFRIAGRLRKIPGETLAFSLINPRVYIPLSYVDRTALLQKGSLVRYRAYFKLPNIDVDAWAERAAPELQRLRLDADTARRRAAAIATAMENLSRYLTLAVFIAVLLSGVGIASVTHVFASAKARSAALLRCIGAGPGETVAVFVLQVLALALISSLLGTALGVVAQFTLPRALKDFLPVNTALSLSPSGIVAGWAVGLGTALLFALIPLLPLRKIAPLSALRASFDAERPLRDRLTWFLFALIACGIWAFAVATTGNKIYGTWFAGGVLGVFAVLLLLARAASWSLRRLALNFLPFSWRQGLANLYRPNNQTAAVTLAIGLGTFLLVTLYSVQSMLVAQVAGRAGPGEPNLVLFDVQRDQRQDLNSLVKAQGLSLHDEVPVVTMRLTAINGRRVEALRADPNSRISRWALRREYRSTYRAGLSGTERIIAGTWQGRATSDTTEIPVSAEKGIAENLRIGLGARLEFEIQGVPITAKVTSIREVDWQRVQPNFFMVFPEGVLEGAPQFYAVVARADNPQVAARAQRAVVQRFPNVSMIDLSLILTTLNSILSKVAAAMRFVALFTIVTGLAVLASAVLGSRAQRLRESILLRTLGAPRRQVLATIGAEYLLLGAIAGFAGTALGVGATWGLSLYFFGTPATIALTPVLAILIIVIAATVLAGAAGCWGIFQRSPLDALRAEA
jgi:putative ABC transport system permease protein